MTDPQLSQYKFGFPLRTSMNTLFPYWDLNTRSSWEDIFDLHRYKELEKSGNESNIRLAFWNYTMVRLDQRKREFFSRYDKAPAIERVVCTEL